MRRQYQAALLLFGLWGLVACAEDDPPPNNHVNLTGSVADLNGAPIAGAEVAVQLGDTRYATAADGAGQYALQFPLTDLPQYFVGLASAPGFLPKSFPLIFSSGTVFTVNASNEVRTAALTPQQVVFPKGLAVTHLGDDPFPSAAEAQFQTPPVGSNWTDSFTLTPQQKNTFGTVAISVTARGVECSSVTMRLTQAGTQVGPPEQELGFTPAIGSFAPITKSFSLAALPPGEITLEIRTDVVTNQTTTTVTGGAEGCVVGQLDDLEFLEVLGTLS